MPSPDSHHLKYRAYIDGLRAVAILPVICFHAGIGFSGGYVGVDVFFVISGYLISALILKELKGDQFRITEFWERRVRRILPALAVMVLACLIAGWYLFFPGDFKKLGQSAVAQALLAANFYFYHDAGYFAPGVDVKPLLHTWSLAVEEQFYLIFPFVLIGFRRFSPKSFSVAILGLCLSSFVLSVYCSYHHPTANFYLPPTRAWELLIGSFLAAIPPSRASIRWLIELLSCGGLLAILWAVFLYDSETRFPGVAALLPCIGAALIIRSNDHTLTFIGKGLSSRPMVFIGMISYSLYLWHWPVLVFFKYWAVHPIPLGQRLLLLVASGVLAALSWKYVETPFRERVILKRRPQIFGFGIITTGALVVAGLTVDKLQGLPSRIPTAALEYLSAASFGESPKMASDQELSLPDALNGNFYELGKGDKGQPINLLVWGDSHAKVLIPVLDRLSKEHSSRSVMAAHPQTAPLVGYDSEGVWSLKNDSIPFNNAIVQFIYSHHVRNVLIVARWDYYAEVDKGMEKLRSDLLTTIEALQKSEARIWIMRDVPRYPWNVPKALASAVLHGRDPEGLGLSLSAYRAQSQSQDPIFEGLAEKFPRVRILDPAGLFASPLGRCRLAQGGKSLYYDSDHVNVGGSMMLAPLFEPIFWGANKSPAPIPGKVGSH